jgi:hypothetical protein
MQEDLEHLRLLAIFHYVVGALAYLCACTPILHVAIGLGMLFGAFDQQQQPPPRIFGLAFVVLGSAIMILGWAFAICMIVAGRMLQKHRAYVFCLVMAGIACMFMPLGTILGVFTLVVLLRPSVRQLFQTNGPPPGSVAAAHPLNRVSN